MATADERREITERISARLNEIFGLDVDRDLIRNNLGDELSFEPARRDFIDTLKLFEPFVGIDLEQMPFVALQKVEGRANEVWRVFEAVRNFTAAQASPVDVRNQLVAEVAAVNDTNHEILLPTLAYVLASQASPDQLRTAVQVVLDETKATTAAQQAEQARITAEMSAALTAVQAQAASAGVAQQAVIFKTQADKHETAKTQWLKVAVGFGALAVGWAVVAFFVVDHPDFQNKAGEAIAFVIGRVVILSLLLYGLFYSTRQFSAHSHNQVVNQHRQNALQTFETFVHATEDVEIRNAVLLEATKSIFASQASGYLKSEADTQSTNTIIEVMRQVSRSS